MNAELEKWIEEHSFNPEHPFTIGRKAIDADDLRALFDGKVLVPVEPDLKGHDTLESMIFTHTNVWRDLILTEIRENRGRRSEESYWKHELKALEGIVSALRLTMLTASQEQNNG
jgi:hypothetical protein